jgi:site-specific recombinase XerD
MAEDIIAMIETFDRGSLGGLRVRAMLLVGYAGERRRSEIVGLDLRPSVLSNFQSLVRAVSPHPRKIDERYVQKSSGMPQGR